MSSASKGRYQSRLFNFFHKQSRRFGEGFGRSLRQLQVATSWSLEALSKSIYLLIQKAADSAGTQLPGTAAESKLYLQPSEELCSDAGIVRVVESVETRYVNSSTNQSTKMVVGASDSLSNQTSEQDARTTLKCSSAKIQGVASQLSSQNLVLVTSENEILDVLTPSQQQTLENQIISEIANYWRSWRLSQVDGETKLPSKINRFFKRLTSINVNPKKVLPALNPREGDRKYLQINSATVASLDTVVANLETNALAPVSQAQIIVRQRGGEFIKVVRTRLDIFLYGNKNVTVGKQDVVVDSNLEHPSKIQALITAAFNYFYSKPQDKKIKQAPAKPLLSSTKSKIPQLQSKPSADDWLSSADLFGNELVGKGFPQLNSRNRILNELEASKEQLNSSTNNKESSEKLFGRFQMPNWRTLRLKERAGLVQPQKDIVKSEQVASITKASRNSQKIVTNSTLELQTRSKGEIAANQTNESTEVEAKPEWIETKAEIVGYQKHPLEQVLAWIDNTMLKIEEAIAKFAEALVGIWRK